MHMLCAQCTQTNRLIENNPSEHANQKGKIDG